MHNVKLLILLALSLIGLGMPLAGCAPASPYWDPELIQARQRTLNGWMGESRIRVIKAMGEPKTTHPDGEGGQILTWEHWDKNGVAQVFIFVNRDDKVYFWREQDPSGLYAPNLEPTPTHKKP